MRAWQPVTVTYPTAEIAIVAATKSLGLPVDFVGDEKPRNAGTAIIWNRIGGRDPTALMQCRVFAPHGHEAIEIARQLAAQLPRTVRGRFGIHRIEQISGITDLGNHPEPMRQLIYEIGLTPERNPS